MEFTVTRYWQDDAGRPHAWHTTYTHAPGDTRAVELPARVRHVAGACEVENAWLATFMTDPPPPNGHARGLSREQYVELGGAL